MNFQIIRVDLQKKYKTNVVKKKDLISLFICIEYKF